MTTEIQPDWAVHFGAVFPDESQLEASVAFFNSEAGVRLISYWESQIGHLGQVRTLKIDPSDPMGTTIGAMARVETLKAMERLVALMRRCQCPSRPGAREEDVDEAESAPGAE